MRARMRNLWTVFSLGLLLCSTSSNAQQVLIQNSESSTNTPAVTGVTGSSPTNTSSTMLGVSDKSSTLPGSTASPPQPTSKSVDSADSTVTTATTAPPPTSPQTVTPTTQYLTMQKRETLATTEVSSTTRLPASSTQVPITTDRPTQEFSTDNNPVTTETSVYTSPTPKLNPTTKAGDVNQRTVTLSESQPTVPLKVSRPTVPPSGHTDRNPSTQSPTTSNVGVSQGETSTTPVHSHTTPTQGTSTIIATTSTAAPRRVNFSKTKGEQLGEESALYKLCHKLMESMMEGNCSLSVTENALHEVVVQGTVDTTVAKKYLDEIKASEKEKQESVPPETLIAILTSCGALALIIAAFAIYAFCHRKSYRKNQVT